MSLRHYEQAYLVIEFLNDHFNSLRDDDSIVSKKLLFKFRYVEVRIFFLFSSLIFPRAMPTADRLVVGILPAKIVN